MKRLNGWTIAAVVLVIGIVVFAVAGTVLADGPWGRGITGPMGSMMGAPAYGPQVPPQADDANTPTPWMGGPWGGMMGGWNGMMGGWGSMMGANGCFGPGGFWGATGTPISAEEAQRIAEDYVARYGNPDLEVAEIMEFDNQFYVQARERSTGRYAFEFLIDRYTGAAHPEPGPNMMWNTKYGHMGGWGGMMDGMMGGWYAPTDEMPISAEEAIAIAREYLDRYAPGLEPADEADAFYGYYTIHTQRDGQIVGMLSVNGYTGQVWPHTWHGQFLGMVFGDEEGDH